MDIEQLKLLREKLANAQAELSKAFTKEEALFDVIEKAVEEKYGAERSACADRYETAKMNYEELEKEVREALITYGKDNPEETNIIAGLSVSRPFALVGEENDAVTWAMENNAHAALKVNTKDKRILNIVIAAQMNDALILNKREFIKAASQADECDLVEKVVQPKITKKDIEEFAKDV